MTVKEYNEWYNKLNHARSFVSCIDHALQKSDENAKMQFNAIGWSEELKKFLGNAIEYYGNHVKETVDNEQKNFDTHFIPDKCVGCKYLYNMFYNGDCYNPYNFRCGFYRQPAKVVQQDCIVNV